MKIKILMKSGNTYIADLDRAKNIIDAYVLLHLNQNELVVIGEDTIINPSEVAEVIAINDNNKIINGEDFNVTLNINTPVNIEKVMNELAEKIKVSNQRL